MPAAAQQPDLFPRSARHIALAGAKIDYVPTLYSAEQARELFAAVRNDAGISWHSDPIKMFGRLVKQPRMTAWMADTGVEYGYSGLRLAAAPWTQVVSRIRQAVEQAAGAAFNSVLINLYSDGNDYMGWHRDDERELGMQPVIASLSLGATRFFDLRHRDYRESGIAVQRLELQSGDLVVMRGDTQRHWQHRVPKQRRVTEARINLSFRFVQGSDRDCLPQLP
ncbi:MAG: alpha-ketoglutarate-dependent dioxygenase AlkB [Gammaproteobacteria bacterium]|nr:alpha-ketoglutarate-dependent dioxygenase AlkB [Gammaproteobacteria bacterium]NNF61574.1 alpha-ketoglutarate-dependent dioxygenase AlkB [Gammaproteobacteria bacterium]